jgi:valyl-tRNA synthetase
MTATTPATTAELSKQYDPIETEAKWQQAWETHQVFKADPNQEGEPYCVVIPPPNVTGSLHMGHAFENTLIDVLVRYHRMAGRNTLWLPGTDHASIAVQTLLERQLKQEGTSRDEVGREAFLERAWQWKEESGGTIVGQLRRLGVSVDWSRERFTLDEGLSKAVTEAFTRLYKEGLIYRGKYMVNWCPSSQSAVSDLEVENKEVDGHLWHLRYPLSDGSGHVEVATTRPETMLGDTAVAVNPNDDRYRHLIGRMVVLPILNRHIPIIADDYVDASFGTGCVKITPAHDPNDFEMGQRHNLPFITIMNKDGTLNEQAGEFAGQDRFAARTNIVQRLEADGFLVRVEDYRHTVPYSDRGKVPVEPLLSTQWFVKIRPLADRALEFLDQRQDPVFVPERWTKVYRDWLVSLRDWCISRQLWWGHQIPAWYAVSETHGEITDETPFIVVATEEEAWQQAREMFGPEVQLQQDPDVLDTWFSSGLWPFSTMGWPEQTPDLVRYYPTTTLVTGFDIIFFWVARMTMMAAHFTGQMPFKTVYIHGLVRDENNKKMSKSANNGIDPLILMDKYGTDALRYTLVREVVGAGQDIRLEYNRKTDESTSVEASRNFTNKLWNASRFVMMNLDGETPNSLGHPEPSQLELCDRWILSRYHRIVQRTRHALDEYGMGEAAKELYEFIWGDFCDWYIELVKSRLQGGDRPSRRVAQQTLATVLNGVLKLLHPFMPHITEEIWHTLNRASASEFLAVQAYPVADESCVQPDLEHQFDLLFQTIRTIRNLRAEAGIKPGAQIQACLISQDAQERDTLNLGQTYIQDLAKVASLAIARDEAILDQWVPQAQVSPFDPVESSQPTLALEHHPLAGISTETEAEKYARIAIALGLFFLTLVTLKVTAAVLHELSTLVIVSPLLRLIGLGYSTWFVYRYLLHANTRAELAKWIDTALLEVGGDYLVPLTSKSAVASAQGMSPAEEMADLRTVTSPTPESGTFAIDSSVAPSSSLSEQPPGGKPQVFAGIVGTIQVLIPLAGMVDVDALRAKLTKDLTKAEAEIQSLSSRLSNPTFVEKAPAEVVQSTRDTLAEAETQAALLRDRLARL